ncbi:putative alpha-2B adrenergic receptor [Trichinella spiralis]|uniref:putative alpha-2B adrenergic receptor n=1 Tax=Trichinella spiralis TaxID=6334 RepID=UPI0001EFC50C|nr:putative alpha-2B adrenergic receptor [Trichinella spiralis]
MLVVVKSDDLTSPVDNYSFFPVSLGSGRKRGRKLVTCVKPSFRRITQRDACPLIKTNLCVCGERIDSSNPTGKRPTAPQQPTSPAPPVCFPAFNDEGGKDGWTMMLKMTTPAISIKQPPRSGSMHHVCYCSLSKTHKRQ